MENSPLVMRAQATEPVFELAVECERLYTNQINSFKYAGNENAAKMLSDLYQRFSSWAAYLGVFAESNVCLDRRLRRHADIQDQVLRLLDIMRRNLIYCTSHPHILILDTDIMDPVSEDVNITLIGTEPPGENERMSQSVSVRMQSLNAVSATLERLNQLGTAIRRSSMAKQVSKARELTETFDLTSFEQMAFMSLEKLYPDCCESLLEQLTRSMVETYALFLHRKSRKARLEVNRSLPRGRQPLQMVPEEPPGDVAGPSSSGMDQGMAIKSDYSKAGMYQAVPVRPIRPLYGAPQTQPTSVDTQEFNAHLKRLSNPSIESKPMSILLNRVGYPRPNKESLVCEWCFGPLTPDFLEGPKWQQHVNEDFKPYLCVSEKCFQPLIRFSSSKQWLQHMISEHGSSWHRDIHPPSYWICPLCTEEGATFHSPDRFSQHLHTHHDGIFQESQAKAIVRQSKFPSARPLFECPLCCLPVTEEQHTVPGKPSTGGNGLEKDYLPTPGGGGPKRIRIDTSSMETRGTSANETVIATHVTAHLQNIMLLNLRLMSIEEPTDAPAGSQGATTETDYQVSKRPSIGGAASDESKKNSTVDLETAKIPLIFNDEESHGRALDLSNIEKDETMKDASDDSEVVITWDFVPIRSYDKENDLTIQEIIAASRAVVSETVASSEGSLPAELTGQGKEWLESRSQSIELKELPIAEGAEFGTYMDQHEEGCLPGTREELLREIDEWSVLPESRCIFWLNGLAGTGKSTISRTVAKSFKERGFLGASFFFKRGEGYRGSATRFFTTIASQLIRIPGLLTAITQVIRDNPEISDKPLEEQFEKLIHQPLRNLERSENQESSMIIVIDALDECESNNDTIGILTLLPRVQEVNGMRVRFFITSRPELPIRLDFRTIGSHQDLVLHEIQRPIIERDLSLFLHHKLARIREERALPPDWPGNTAIQALVTMSVPLFIFAATVCRLFEDRTLDPAECLTKVLAFKNKESKLDGTYLPVFKQLIDKLHQTRREQLIHEVREVVGTIILLESPLSVASLSRLMRISIPSIYARINSLHSVINIPTDEETPVRTFHSSFRDFLLDPDTRRKTPFWIDERDTHKYLTACCLHIMGKKLKKNICNLQSYGTERMSVESELIGNHLPPELQYSSRYWTHHLVESRDAMSQSNEILAFLNNHFLHWVEVMSLLDAISEALRGIHTLQSVFEDIPELYQLLCDGERLVLKNSQILDITPLQIYASGLVFTPNGSIFRQKFAKDIPAQIYKYPIVEDLWGPELQTLEGHSHLVLSVAFSPDGRQLASGSDDKTIKIWDPAIGHLKHTLEGHSHPVLSVAFSPDGQQLASGSADKTIKIWDPAISHLKHTLEGHSNLVLSVAFSPDGRQLASGSTDKTIKIWDPATCHLRHTLDTMGTVTRIRFSKNASFLITNLGNFNIQHNVQSSHSTAATSHNAISIQSGQWVSIQARPELWLPPEYRPGDSAVYKNVLAVGCSSGKVWFMHLNI